MANEQPNDYQRDIKRPLIDFQFLIFSFTIKSSGLCWLTEKCNIKFTNKQINILCKYYVRSPEVMEVSRHISYILNDQILCITLTLSIRSSVACKFVVQFSNRENYFISNDAHFFMLTSTPNCVDFTRIQLYVEWNDVNTEGLAFLIVICFLKCHRYGASMNFTNFVSISTNQLPIKS